MPKGRGLINLPKVTEPKLLHVARGRLGQKERCIFGPSGEGMGFRQTGFYGEKKVRSNPR